MPGPAALLDANVLYSAGLRDFLLRLADRNVFVPLWSAEIHAEWIRGVLEDRPDLTPDKLERTRIVMDQYFPDAIVTDYENAAIGVDLPDPDDLHVLAAAIHADADIIVTMNLRDFPNDVLAPYALVAQHPDALVRDLFESHRDAVLAATREHRAALQNPPRSINEHLAALQSLGLVETTSALRLHGNSL